MVDKSSSDLNDDVFVFYYDLISSNNDTVKTYSFIINFSSEYYDVDQVIDREGSAFLSYGYFNAKNLL